ncbi:hypothetical protein AABM36_03130 [Kocuria sp. KSNUG]|uniref:hypothetical protein n=1 Tax=Kocuria sp. KSNUG TaxID=3136676 RepID=UPI003C2C1A23
MTQQPENTDPIASAGQIDDPDQPTTMKGQDDSRAGRDTQPDESATDGDPDQPGTSRHAASAPRSGTVRDADGATAASATRGAVRDDRGETVGKPPKAIRETGVPVVDGDAVDAASAREVDSEALAGTRKFQPRPGDANPNVSDNPENFPDHENRSAHEGVAGGGDVREHTSDRDMVNRNLSDLDRDTDDRHVTRRETVDRTTADAQASDQDTTRQDRDTDDGNSTVQYENPESIPAVEPVRHSRMVEERVQEQERDFDLGTTEDGERYLTPKDVPGA